MKYKIIISKQAKKKLLSVPNPLKQRIAEKIAWLGVDPDNPKLDVKRLAGSSNYRLRVGDWRIIYDRDDQIRIISIESIKSRGEVYK